MAPCSRTCCTSLIKITLTFNSCGVTCRARRIRYRCSFFDAAGNKLGGQDYVVGHAPVARHLIEASSLPSGDYVVKLIFYNFRTGKSVPGTVSSDSTRFGRELDVTAIRKR